jgi:hypothetical protein
MRFRSNDAFLEDQYRDTGDNLDNGLFPASWGLVLTLEVVSVIACGHGGDLARGMVCLWADLRMGGCNIEVCINIPTKDRIESGEHFECELI